MARNEPAPFNQPTDTGKNGYRNPEFEPYPDERPVIYDRFPFWKDEDERLRYERAAKHMPVSQYGKLTDYQYMAAIAGVARGLIAPEGDGVKAMPKLGRVR